MRWLRTKLGGDNDEEYYDFQYWLKMKTIPGSVIL